MPAPNLVTTNDIDPSGGLTRDDYLALRHRERDPDTTDSATKKEPAPATVVPPIPALPGDSAPLSDKTGDTSPLDQLVSVNVTDSVPVREVLMELVRKTGANLELDPRVSGTVIISAHDQRWTPQTLNDHLQVLDVSANEVRLSWHGDEDQPPQEFTLKPNETFQIATGKVIAGP